MQYIAKFRADLGKAIPEIGGLFDKINTHIANDGYDERIKCHANIFDISVTVDRELTEEEEYRMKVILESEVIEHFPLYDIRLDSFRRQSGNVSQSVS